MAAYENKNLTEFERWFDTDNFSRNLWTDYEEWQLQNLDSVCRPIRSNIDSADSLKVTIRNIVSGKKILKELDATEENASKTVSFAQILENLHAPTIITLSENDSEKKFRITAKTFDEQEFNFELIMRNSGGNWKISELTNVGEVCTAFKNFAKDSFLAYLKRVQPIQDKYDGMWKAANELPTNGSTTEEVAALLEAYYSARKQADDYRVEELSKAETNPFSDILNSGRINVSKNFSQYWDYSLKAIKKGMETKSFSNDEVKALEKQAEEYNELAKAADFNVRFLISLVKYEP